MRAHIKAYLSASKVRFFLTFGKEVILLRSLDHVCELLDKFAVNNQVIIPKVEGPRYLNCGLSVRPVFKEKDKFYLACRSAIGAPLEKIDPSVYTNIKSVDVLYIHIKGFIHYVEYDCRDHTIDQQSLLANMSMKLKI